MSQASSQIAQQGFFKTSCSWLALQLYYKAGQAKAKKQHSLGHRQAEAETETN